jgi:hypothetical protein
MPMLTKHGRPDTTELPSTVARSGKKAQRTFAKAHDAAQREYGDGERAMRTAWSKNDLVTAIQAANRRHTRTARRATDAT